MIISDESGNTILLGQLSLDLHLLSLFPLYYDELNVGCVEKKKKDGHLAPYQALHNLDC